jgi:hypothetical protein
MNDTAVLDILKRARARIADPEHWTQGEEARDAAGRPTDEGGPDAVRRCAFAAIWVEEKPGELPEGNRPWEVLQALAAPQCLSTFNDTHSHAEVLALFDRAIALLAGEG